MKRMAILLLLLAAFAAGRFFSLPVSGSVAATVTPASTVHNPAVVRVWADQPDGASVYGTGFNVSPEGLIITNRHVIRNAVRVKVTFPDGTELMGAQWNYDSRADLAYIRFANLPHIALADTEPVAVGNAVSVIGYPGYVKEQVLWEGKITSLRATTIGSKFVNIRTNIKVAPGSSGSPVFGAGGNVVGVICSAQGISSYGAFIPIEAVRQFVGR